MTLVRRLQSDPRVVEAARVAKTFHLDPVAVASETDRRRRALRAAAHNVVQDEMAEVLGVG